MCRSTRRYGRIATTLFVVYPPGIASIVPGERLDERARPMLDYLKMFETSANLFPGFEVEIQGIYREVEKRRPGALPHLRGAGIVFVGRQLDGRRAPPSPSARCIRSVSVQRPNL